MRYLLFQDVNRDYGCTFDTVWVGSRSRGFGAYEDKDGALVLKLAPDNLVSEIPKETYEYLKKKLNQAPVSSKQLGLVAQDPSKNPNAVYAEKESEVQSEEKPVKDLVSVGEATVEDPLEGTE